MNRVLDVARIQLIAWPAAIGWPFGVLAIAFVANLAVFGTMGGAPDDSTTGGLLSIYVVVFVGCVQSVSQVFPFLAGLSVTRRAFFAGTALLILAESLAFAAVLVVLRLVEDATRGWGLGLEFFAMPYLRHDNLLVQLVVYAVPFIAFSFVGVFCGVVHKRWGSNGLFALMVLSIALGGAWATLVTWRDAWPSVGHWFTSTSPLAMVAGWPLLVGVTLAGVAYLGLRRAVP